ncbi:hypothetical protein [Macrococcus bovicus]|uniref:Uncharacterized protein n=1 Tax=Macrococcus bovicus TaxID=69968 RepID=A0A4R6BV72_9STAP|nr:hypothetical protein [Macrococcus bovicus]TDM12171.1 hypothetical protein ERX55_11150 [Macrococcus bovicus]
MDAKRRELEELEKKRKELLKEIKAQEQQHYRTLIEFFGDDFPRNENKRPISLKQFKEEYMLVKKKQYGNFKTPNDERRLETYEKMLGVLRSAADNIDYSQGFPKLPNLPEFTKWVEKFKTKN